MEEDIEVVEDTPQVRPLIHKNGRFMIQMQMGALVSPHLAFLNCENL